MEWHAETGLAATFIEAPLDLQQQRQTSDIRPDQVALCTAAGIKLPYEIDDKSHEHTENEEAITIDDPTYVQKIPRYAD